MNLLRFLGLLFVFVSVSGGCAGVVALLVLMLRFWPLALAIVLALILFHRLLQRLGLRISC